VLGAVAVYYLARVPKKPKVTKVASSPSAGSSDTDARSTKEKM
jgi:hypothetical protein